MFTLKVQWLCENPKQLLRLAPRFPAARSKEHKVRTSCAPHTTSSRSPKPGGRASRQLSRGCGQLCQAAWHHTPDFLLHMNTELHRRRKLFLLNILYKPSWLLFFSDENNNDINLGNDQVSSRVHYTWTLPLLSQIFFRHYVRFGNLKFRCTVIRKVSPINTN